MNDVFGVIFAYSDGDGMKELTAHRTSASVPFGARYRAIDFALSNMVNAGICEVGIVMREGYQSLMEHIGSGRDWDLSRKIGGLVLLPPSGYVGASALRSFDINTHGKINALIHIENYIKNRHQKYVVLCDGHVCANIRIDEMIENHIKSGADITAVTTSRVSEPERSLYFTKKGDRICGILAYPKEACGEESLGMYIMERKLLEQLIEYGKTNDCNYLEREVLRQLMGKLYIRAELFRGYAAKMQSVETYFKYSFDLLNPEVRSELFSRENPIYTRIRDEMPTYYSDSAEVSNSLVADGCYIEGKVENSVLFRGVKVEAGAVIKNSVIMQHGKIMENAFLNGVIADKDVNVLRDAMIVGNMSYPVVITKGATV